MKRIIALVMLLPSVALTQEDSQISYDWFDLSYYRTDWDSGAIETDGTGWAGRFSIGIREHVYLGGEYRNWEADGIADGSTYKRFGFGVHRGIGDRWSIFGEAGFTSLDLDLGAGNIEDDPAYFAAGVRWYVADGYELRLSGEFTEAGRGTPVGRGEAAVTFGGDMYITDAVAITIEATENDDHTTSFLIGFRIYHKKDTSGLRQRR
ncbi:MAG TPA: hypothetical protein VMR74_03875 [Gammaproteobacteria bacterium]|nr:hypothetical protein [Gammaproteobacteria bacterium]